MAADVTSGEGGRRARSLGTAIPCVAVVLVALALTGCLTGPTDASDGAADRPALASFAGCNWTYPNGEPVPCESPASSLSVEDGPPDSWICVKSPRETWNVYQSPEGEYGIYYDVSQADHLELLFRNVERPRFFYNWSDDDVTGFVRLADSLDDGEEFVFMARQIDYNFTSNVTSGEPRIGPLWSWYEDDAWVVHEIRVDGASYTFQRITRGYTYGDYAVDGEDFRFATEGGTWIKAQVFPRTYGTGFREHCPSRT